MNETIPALLFDAHDRRPDQPAILYPVGAVWKATTLRDSVREVAALARGMAARGIGRGSVVGILSNTRHEWTAIDFAALCLGAVVVGIYPTLLPEQVAWLLRHGGVELLVVEGVEQAAKIEAVRAEVPGLAHVFAIEDTPGWDGLDALKAEPDAAWLRARAREVRPDDVATLIYTSGTTGKPKGVVLTHGAFVRVARATIGLIPVEPGDRSVAWLPLAHSFQRFTVYRGLLEDIVGYYAPSIAALPDTLLVARPHILASVPRMLEKIRDKVITQVEARGGLVKQLFDAAFAVGRERLAYIERGEAVPLGVRLRWRIADRVVFRKVKDRLGGHLRVLVSGGAALDPEVARWYGAMGILVLEGWGLSETCAPATANTPEAFRFGTVGRAIPGVELKVADDGEILFRGPGLFVGYHDDPEATAEVMVDGWFHTGDIGAIDADGYLTITDRKKAILVTAGGKNIAPVPIEKRLERHPVVGQAIVVGSERPYLVALLVPDPDAVAALAARHGWPDEPPEARVRRPEIADALAQAVAQCNDGLARFETVKKWAAVPEPFSVETGELTPTLKLKRRVVLERHAERIHALYAG